MGMKASRNECKQCGKSDFKSGANLDRFEKITVMHNPLNQGISDQEIEFVQVCMNCFTVNNHRKSIGNLA